LGAKRSSMAAVQRRLRINVVADVVGYSR